MERALVAIKERKGKEEVAAILRDLEMVIEIPSFNYKTTVANAVVKLYKAIEASTAKGT